MEICFKKGDIQVTRMQTLVLPIFGDGTLVDETYKPILRRYPVMAAKMRELCKSGTLSVGKLWIYRHHQGRYVLVFPLRESPDSAESIDIIRVGLEKIRESYEARGITSLAIPLLSTQDGLLELEKDILSEIDIPVDIYLENIPLSTTLPPLVSKLCGQLNEEEIRSIRENLCFEK